MVNELNVAKSLILKQFKLGIGTLMRISGLIMIHFNGLC